MQRKELQLQRNELELQRQELKQNTAELSRSASAQEAAEKALTEQIIMMSRAAKINALSSLLNSHTMEFTSPRPPSNKRNTEAHIKNFRSQLSKIQAAIPNS